MFQIRKVIFNLRQVFHNQKSYLTYNLRKLTVSLQIIKNISKIIDFDNLNEFNEESLFDTLLFIGEIKEKWSRKIELETFNLAIEIINFIIHDLNKK